MNQNKTHPAEATAYLQVRLDKRRTMSASEAKVVKITQAKPDQAAPGCIVVKVKLRIPAEGWDAFEPSAVIDVPADLVGQPGKPVEFYRRKYPFSSINHNRYLYFISYHSCIFN